MTRDHVPFPSSPSPPSTAGEVDGDILFRSWLNDSFPKQSEVAWSSFWSRAEDDIRHASLALLAGGGEF
jgi:hypothetical protein